MAAINRRNRLVYGLLVLAWALVIIWQAIEHRRVQQAARAALTDRSRDITTTLGLVIRSQRRFGGIVSQERLESALRELVKSGELSAVALLNAAGEIVVSAGAPIDRLNELNGLNKSTSLPGKRSQERWGPASVTLFNVVDLGISEVPQGGTNRPTIVLPRRPQEGLNESNTLNRLNVLQTNDSGSTSAVIPTVGPSIAHAVSPPNLFNSSNSFNPSNPPNRFNRFNRARMTEEEYRQLLEQRGLHGLVLAMSTGPFWQTCRQDLWMRGLIAGFATVSMIGLGIAWRNVAKSSDLQMRLLRASQMNTHLREMNVAVAGLAHETRNPLNIIRGLAQLISKQTNGSGEIRARSREIIDEADRVTSQLNEFINYSRPREVRRAPVALGSIIAEVVRALNYDIEEKHLQLQVADAQITIEADEQLLRQALFNVLMNAIQAVEPASAIQIVTAPATPGEATLEIRDHGPGVPPEHRADIFKPYFTTHQKGTGLGLAVVQQIVLAHGWEIECLPNQPRGSIFRFSHLALSLKPVDHAG